MVNSGDAQIDRTACMPEGLLPILLIIAAVAVYTVVKVVENMRKSERQWREVDKSKLKEWQDDD